LKAKVLDRWFVPGGSWFASYGLKNSLHAVAQGPTIPIAAQRARDRFESLLKEMAKDPHWLQPPQ
jgi:hypothetical protein